MPSEWVPILTEHRRLAPTQPSLNPSIIAALIASSPPCHCSIVGFLILSTRWYSCVGIAAMAQSGLWAVGMQSVGAVNRPGWLQIECGRVRLNPAATSLRQVRCGVEDEGKMKKAPVRLPGGRQVPAYGGSLPNSPPGLGQFKPPHLFGMLELEPWDIARLGVLLWDSTLCYGMYHFLENCLWRMHVLMSESWLCLHDSLFSVYQCIT